LPSLNEPVVSCACFVKGVAVPASRLVNRNVIAGSGRTSMRLEPELWDALVEICQREGGDLHALIRNVDAGRDSGGRTSAVRVFVLQYYRAAATEAGHAAAGHGPHVARRAA
jgi:predicted DNA-binding ribbon-helix-helix protein